MRSDITCTLEQTTGLLIKFFSLKEVSGMMKKLKQKKSPELDLIIAFTVKELPKKPVV